METKCERCGYEASSTMEWRDHALILCKFRILYHHERPKNRTVTEQRATEGWDYESVVGLMDVEDRPKVKVRLT